MSKNISRRDALRAFAMVSSVNLLDLSAPQVERALRGVAGLGEESQQGPAYVPKFFTRHEWQTVRMLVDYVIPRDEKSGSATDAKVPEYMDWLLADKEANENTRIAMRGGLAWIDLESRERFGKQFIAATDAQRRQVLDDIAWPAKAPAGLTHGVAFFSRFRDFTAAGFFSSFTGWKDLQYMGNVFHHWDGCPPATLEKLGVSYDLMNTRVPVGR